MTQGRIKRLNETGFGFITASDECDYFFHRSALADGVGFDALDVGQLVEFEATEGSGRGPRAERVRVLRDE